MSRLVLC